MKVMGNRAELVARVMQGRQRACSGSDCRFVRQAFSSIAPTIESLSRLPKPDRRDADAIEKAIARTCNGKCDCYHGLFVGAKGMLRDLRAARDHFNALPASVQATASSSAKSGRDVYQPRDHFDALSSLVQATARDKCVTCGVLEAFGGHVALELPHMLSPADLDPRFTLSSATVGELKKRVEELLDWCKSSCWDAQGRLKRVEKTVLDYVHNLRAHVTLTGIGERVVERTASGCLFIETREDVLARALKSPQYARIREFVENPSEVESFLAHELVMDFRVLALFGLNVFTKGVNARDGSREASLQTLRVSRAAEHLLALAGFETAREFSERVRLLECAATLNNASACVQKWEKMRAFEELMARSGRADKQILATLLKMRRGEMSEGELFVLKQLQSRNEQV